MNSRQIGRVLSQRFSLIVALLLAALLSWVLMLSLHVQGQSNRKVNSVSASRYSQIVAPEQIVAAFGANLTTETVQAKEDTDLLLPGIQLPTQLGGLSVEVNGRSAGLFYVSPGQINFQAPPNLEPGTGYVTVRS